MQENSKSPAGEGGAGSRKLAEENSSKPTTSARPAQRALEACAARRRADDARDERLNRKLLEVIREIGAVPEVVNGMTEGVIACPCGRVTRIGVLENQISVFTRGQGSGSCEVPAAIRRLLEQWRLDAS